MDCREKRLGREFMKKSTSIIVGMLLKGFLII
jgi:hypothetical protein